MLTIFRPDFLDARARDCSSLDQKYHKIHWRIDTRFDRVARPGAGGGQLQPAPHQIVGAATRRAPDPAPRTGLIVPIRTRHGTL